MGKSSTRSYTIADLKYQVSKAWQFKDWSLLAIGLGHYVFSFRNEQERDACWGKGKWNLEHGSALFLQVWQPKFVPTKPPKRPVALVRVWVQFKGLCSEDFNITTIRSLARALGTVVKIDMEAYSKGIGKIAKVLIDIDLRTSLEHELRLETSVGNCLISVRYLNLPLYCKDCNSLGHNLDSCPRKNKSSVNGAKSTAAVVDGIGKKVDEVRAMVDEDGFEVPKYQQRYKQWRKDNPLRDRETAALVGNTAPLEDQPVQSEAIERTPQVSEEEEESDSQDVEDSGPVLGCPFSFDGMDNVVVVPDSQFTEQALLGKPFGGDCAEDAAGPSSLKSNVVTRQQKKTWAQMKEQRRASKRRGM